MNTTARASRIVEDVEAEASAEERGPDMDSSNNDLGPGENPTTLARIRVATKSRNSSQKLTHHFRQHNYIARFIENDVLDMCRIVKTAST
jgi:hypothetical protein